MARKLLMILGFLASAAAACAQATEYEVLTRNAENWDDVRALDNVYAEDAEGITTVIWREPDADAGTEARIQYGYGDPDTFDFMMAYNDDGLCTWASPRTAAIVLGDWLDELTAGNFTEGAVLFGAADGSITEDPPELMYDAALKELQLDAEAALRLMDETGIGPELFAQDAGSNNIRMHTILPYNRAASSALGTWLVRTDKTTTSNNDASTILFYLPDAAGSERNAAGLRAIIPNAAAATWKAGPGLLAYSAANTYGATLLDGAFGVDGGLAAVKLGSHGSSVTGPWNGLDTIGSLDLQNREIIRNNADGAVEIRSDAKVGAALLVLKLGTASQASASDAWGIEFNALNSTPAEFTFAEIVARVTNATAGSEEAILEFHTQAGEMTLTDDELTPGVPRSLGTSGNPWGDGYIETPFRRAGNSTSWIPLSATLWGDIADAGNVGAGEDTLYSHSISASTLETDGDMIRFHVTGTFANTAVNKRVKAHFGSTAFLDTGSLAFNAAATWHIEGTITRTGATTQRCEGWWGCDDATLTFKPFYATAAETLSGAITWKVTGEATNDNDIVAKMSDGQWRREGPM